jgi:hypothetical protein
MNIYGVQDIEGVPLARSQDPQREGHGHGGMKNGMGRAEWDEVWTIDH